VWGFVHPRSGRTEWLITTTVSGAGTSAALRAFADEVAAGPDRRIVLVIDGAGWHTAPEVVVPEGIHLVFQPPYSPELQPAERLWPLLRESLANRDFVDIDEHRDVTARRCLELAAQPDVIRARTLMHWWPQDHVPKVAEPAAERAAS
jgi:transposase